jgi:sensor histidine kinase regulating citrate/malate metabolism
MIAEQKQKISTKLSIILMLSSTAAMIIASSIIIFFYNKNLREDLYHDAVSHAEVIAQNSKAAVAFNVQGDAEVVISSLASEPSIAYACILDSYGEVFVEYFRKDVSRDKNLSVPKKKVNIYQDGKLHVFNQFSVGESVSATVYLLADMKELNRNLSRILWIILFAIFVGLLFSYLISLRLQRIVSKPIIYLSKTAQNIS